MNNPSDAIRDDIVSILSDIYDSETGSVNENVQNKEDLVVLISELFSLGLNVQECEFVTDILINLLRQVQEDICSALARRVSSMQAVPLRLLMYMVDDGIDVARYVLRDSPVFNEQDLVYIIKSHAAEYWHEISKRKDLGHDTVDALLDTNDVSTALELSKNTSITLDKSRLLRLAQFGDRDISVLQNTLVRDEVNQSIFASLYEGVGAALKEYVQTEFPDYSHMLAPAVDELVDDFIKSDDEIGTASRSGDPKAGDDYDIIGPSVFIKTLHQRNIDQFLKDFSRYMSIDILTLESVLADSTGKGLAVLCRASDISKADFITMFNLLRTNFFADLEVSPKQVTKAEGYYDQIRPNSASYVVSKLRRGEVLL